MSNLQRPALRIIYSLFAQCTPVCAKLKTHRQADTLINSSPIVVCSFSCVCLTSCSIVIASHRSFVCVFLFVWSPYIISSPIIIITIIIDDTSSSEFQSSVPRLVRASRGLMCVRMCAEFFRCESVRHVCANCIVLSIVNRMLIFLLCFVSIVRSRVCAGRSASDAYQTNYSCNGLVSETAAAAAAAAFQRAHRKLITTWVAPSFRANRRNW